MSLTSSPWLSILLPVYGVAPYVLACAESILSQADQGVELLFLDDASPDDSAALIAALQSRDPRVRLLHQTHNQGISAARNRLLDEAQGSYLWFVDPDDLMEPGAIARVQKAIAQHQPDLLMCDFRAFDDGATEPGRARYQHIASFIGPPLGEDVDSLLSGLFQAGQLHPWSKIVRRAAWPTTLRFPVGRVFEDLSVYPRLAVHLKRYVHLPEVAMAYRQRAGSTLSQLNESRLGEWMSALDGYAAELPSLQDSTRFEIAHFCARTLVRASKRRSRLSSTGLKADLQRYAQQFRSASPLPPAQLLNVYLKQGKWLRWLQLRYWLAKGA